MDVFIRFCLRGRDLQAPETRQRCGTLSGGIGIGLNLLDLPREKLRVGNMLPAIFFPIAYVPLANALSGLWR